MTNEDDARDHNMQKYIEAADHRIRILEEEIDVLKTVIQKQKDLLELYKSMLYCNSSI